MQINGDPKDNNAKLFKEGATAVFTDKGIDVAQEYDTPDWLPENAQKEMDQADHGARQGRLQGRPRRQ